MTSPADIFLWQVNNPGRCYWCGYLYDHPFVRHSGNGKYCGWAEAPGYRDEETQVDKTPGGATQGIRRARGIPRYQSGKKGRT